MWIFKLTITFCTCSVSDRNGIWISSGQSTFLFASSVYSYIWFVCSTNHWADALSHTTRTAVQSTRTTGRGHHRSNLLPIQQRVAVECEGKVRRIGRFARGRSHYSVVRLLSRWQTRSRGAHFSRIVRRCSGSNTRTRPRRATQSDAGIDSKCQGDCFFALS